MTREVPAADHPVTSQRASSGMVLIIIGILVSRSPPTAAEMARLLWHLFGSAFTALLIAAFRAPCLPESG